MLGILAACSGGASDSTRIQGAVLIERWAASAGDPASLDPAHAIYTLPQASIPYALFDQLMTYDPARRQVVPMLAANVSSNETATEWTFTLRADARWHDGEPVLPSDVKYAWERIVAPSSASRWAALFASIKGYSEFRNATSQALTGVHAEDATRKLTVELTAPFSEFPELVTQLPFSPVPARLLAKLPPGTRWDDTLIVGNGPFQMARPWRHGRDILLQRFDAYYGGALGHAARLDGIEFRIAKDVDASFTELEAGTAQIAFMPPTRYAEIKARSDLTVIDAPMSATWYLGFNMSDPVVGGAENVKLRTAIAYAIDRKAIVDVIYQGGRRIGHTITPPELDGLDDGKAPVQSRDIAAAKAALSEWGGAARLTAPIRLIYNIGSGQENVAAMIQSNLQEIGLAVAVKSFDSAQFPAEILQPQTMMFRQLVTFTYPSPDAGLYPLLHSKSVGTNLPRYSNQELDRLLDEARATLDAASRRKLYAEAERVALADMPVIPVFHYKAAGVMSKVLDNVIFMPSGYMAYGNAELR